MNFARVLSITLVLASAPVALAQTTDVHAAAAAFEEAQRAQLRGDFGQAADLFEIADRSAPNPAALRAAIRNHRAASRPARAATLASEARTRYPDDADTQALATETLDALTPTLGRVDVRCATPCSVTLDGRAVLDHTIESYEVFVEPGAHALVASWRGAGTEHRDIEAHAAEQISVELSAPAVAVAPPPEPDSAVEPPTADPPVPHSSGLHPALFGALAGVAAVGLGITIWSGVDTINGAAEYRENPTHARYDDGISREVRTNVLVGVTAAFAVAALVTVFFTDWDDIGPGPDESVSLTPSFYASNDGGGAMILGRYAP